MIFHILTLFPDMIHMGVNTSILGRALEKKLIEVNAIDIRDFSDNKHKNVDDYPYGGGAGMVMQAQPVYAAFQSIKCTKNPRVIYLSPQGKTFDQSMAIDLAKEEELVLLCGHYEGIDERVLEEIVTEEISIGDYVLTGGELAALVIVDATARLVPGVLNNEDSAKTESFHNNLLEYPQYSRPQEWNGKLVPDVLLSGHHENIRKWRLEQSICRTAHKRPELLKRAEFSEADLKIAEKTLKILKNT